MDKDMLQKLENPPYGKDGNKFFTQLLRRFRGDKEIESILTNRWEPRTIEEAVIVALASNDLKLIWNDEKLKYEAVGQPVEIRQALNADTLAQCEALGRDMAERLMAAE
jgi:hypothetical protein